MMRDLLLALGIVMANATQLRLPGTALGLGEICLAGWIGLTLALEARRLSMPLNFALSSLLVFWLVFGFAQSLGWLMALALEDFRDTASAIHTSIAYLLFAALSCLMVVQPDTWARLRRVIWLACAIGGAGMVVLLAGAHGLVPLPGIEPWIWTRLRGWSENPNQFAFLCTALALLSLHLAETAQRSEEAIVALACAVPSFIAGILTKSDSFILFALIAAPLFILSKMWIWLFAVDSRLSFRAAVASVMFLGVPAMLVSAAPFAPTMIEKAEQFATSTMEQNNQAENRFKLWQEALEIGINAGMLGLGPGPHLVNKQWKRPPPDKFEAHNTVLDLFTQGGVIAAVAFLWLTGAAFVVAYKAGFVSLATLILSVFVFSNFHFIGRHPIFWFSVALCLAAGDCARETTRAGRKS